MATFFSDPFAGIHVDEEPTTYSFDNGDLEVQLARECLNSRPFFIIDMLWNLAFIVVSIVVLLVTFREKPSTPLRLWISVYALQCLLHVGFVWNEYHRRNRGLNYSSGNGQDFYVLWVFPFSTAYNNSIIKKLEMINTIVSSIWWVFGFYWIVIGGQSLLQDSPHLYWLSVIYLALDVFFMMFSIAMASFLFLLLFCCFPILSSLVYAMKIESGASENVIGSLPRFCFRQQQSSVESFEGDKKQENLRALPELVLQPEDSECCICLHNYVDGAEVCTLPCNHHFHQECISRWLRINASCPLCKFDILRGDTLV